MKLTAADVQKQLNQTSEGPMRGASKALHDAGETKAPDPSASPEQKKSDADQRVGELKNSSGAQQQASDQLKSAMERLGNFGGLTEAIAKFQAIRDAQTKLAREFNEQMKGNVGKKPEEMSKDDQAKAAQQAKDQAALSQAHPERTK